MVGKHFFQPSTEIQVKLEDLTYIDGKINITAKMSPSNSIDIATPFWFVNHTNLDLQFSDSGGSRCSLDHPHISMDKIHGAQSLEY